MSITLTPYNPSWPDQFERLAETLRPALGKTAEITHIGSTAVPGLVAKPIIDMQLGVAQLSRFQPAQLHGTLFEFEPLITADDPPFWDDPSPEQWRKAYFRVTERGERVAHLHVREIGCRNHVLAVRFRDYLRAHPEVARAYARMKTVAAEAGGVASHTGGAGPYLDLKGPFVELVLMYADRWARAKGAPT